MDEEAGPPQMAVQVTRRGGYVVAAVAGSVELGNHEVLHRLLDQAADQARAALLVDMGQVAFCGSRGLNVFARLHRRAVRDGFTLVLCALTGQVARSFAITGMTQLLYVRPDVEDAVHWLDTGQSQMRDGNGLAE